jgi:hypothetical protein
VVPVQVRSSKFFAVLVKAASTLAPVSTVLLMAEHALDRLEASPADSAQDDVLTHTLDCLSSGGVWERLDPERAMSLGIRALQHFGAPLSLCLPAVMQTANGFALCVLNCAI